jgi:hypothetical protein
LSYRRQFAKFSALPPVILGRNEEIMKIIRLFNSGDMTAIMHHAEGRARDGIIQPKSKEQAARWAEAVAREWCRAEDGFDDIDRQAYRAAWYHAVKEMHGW